MLTFQITFCEVNILDAQGIIILGVVKSHELIGNFTQVIFRRFLLLMF